MQVLVTVKVVLSQIGLSAEPFASIAGRMVPSVAIRSTFVAFQLVHAFSQIANCVSSYHSKNITVTLSSFHFGLASIVSATVYVALIWKIGEIMDTFDFVQNVVDERMQSQFRHKVLNG